MTSQAAGTFEVTLSSEPVADESAGSFMSRMSIRKQYRGALDATGRGEMLTAGSAVKGSAGYVAMERVTGVLDGRRGSFALQHRGVMNRGVPELLITVVPDTGTDELTGLSGVMNVQIENGVYSYAFTYSLANIGMV